MTITSSLLTGIPGVRTCVVGDLSTAVTPPAGPENCGESWLAVSSVIAREFSKVAELAGLGVTEVVSITGTRPAWVIAYRRQSAIVAEVDAQHSVTQVELALKETDWLAGSEWVLSDSDIEYLPLSDRSPGIQAKPPVFDKRSRGQGNEPD